MKPPKSRHPHDTLQTALRSAFPIDARRLVVLSALILAVIQARTVVLYNLKTHVQLPGTISARYQRLLRFVQFPIPDGLFPRFALSFLPDGPLDLILDRTFLGRTDAHEDACPQLKTRAAGHQYLAALRRLERLQPPSDVDPAATRRGQ